MLIEFYYQRRSKLFYSFFVVCIILASFMFLSQVSLVSNNFNNLQAQITHALDNNFNLSELMQEDFSVSQIGQYADEINNPVRYFYLAYLASIAAMNPQNGINQLLSSSFFIFFPIIAAMYGIAVATVDIKYKTGKIRRSTQRQWKINFKKLLASLMSILILLFSSIAIFVLLQIFYKLFFLDTSSFPDNFSVINQISFLSNAPIQILLILFAAIINLVVFFYLTLIIKNNLVSISILIIYNLFLPVLGRFDFKNIVLYLYPKVFNTNASIFRVSTALDVELGIIAVLVGVVFFLGYILLSEFIYIKKIAPLEK